MVLLVTAAWLLWPGIHGPFLFDDTPNFENLRELGGHLDRRSIGVYLSLFTGTPGRPLSALSFLLNDMAWPSQPLGFKLTNLWIHLLNGVLVFGLARTLASAWRDPRATGTPAAHPDLVALGCAALWLLHPIQISAVFLTVQRMAELAATCMFAGLWGYVALAQRARTNWQAFSALFVLGAATILGMLCKENGILLPVLVLALHATLLRPMLQQRPPMTARWLRLGVAGAVVALVAAFAWKWKGLTGFGSRDYTMWERVMSQGRALVDYAGLIVAPQLSGSSLYNDDFAISRGLLQPATTLPALLMVLATLLAGLLVRRRMPLLAFALLWFFAAHLLESTVFPLELYFEHRNYVPLFGPAFAVAAAALRVTGKLRRPVLAGLGVWLALAATLLNLQARVWGDEGRLATVWYTEHPTSLRAQQQYAIWLSDNGRLQEAHAVMARAAVQGISPVDSGLQALTVKCMAHRPIPAGEVAAVGSRLHGDALSPGTGMALRRLRGAVQSGDCPNAISPEVWFALSQHALDNPRGRGIHRMLRMERAELWLAAHRLDDAIAEMDRAYRGRKQNPRIAFYAAALLATAGRYDEAREWAARPLGKPWTWKRWLAQTDQQAIELIETIDKDRARGPLRPRPLK